jgi:3-phenylpropionate/cinnamic acid dioxygenase small subunit
MARRKSTRPAKRPAKGKTAAPRGRAVTTGRRAPGRPAAGDTLRAVEQFLYRQADLLDSKRWQEYIDLFAPDGIYWMPAEPGQTTWEGVPAIFAEDRNLMTVRMKRVQHPDAWSQRPLWGTNHVVSNVSIEQDGARELVVRSRFHMMELRRDDVRHFAGTYRHHLVRATSGDGFRIKLQRVDPINAQATYDYVLQVWV